MTSVLKKCHESKFEADFQRDDGCERVEDQVGCVDETGRHEEAEGTVGTGLEWATRQGLPANSSKNVFSVLYLYTMLIDRCEKFLIDFNILNRFCSEKAELNEKRDFYLFNWTKMWLSFDEGFFEIETVCSKVLEFSQLWAAIFIFGIDTFCIFIL